MAAPAFDPDEEELDDELDEELDDESDELDDSEDFDELEDADSDVFSVDDPPGTPDPDRLSVR